MINWNDFQTMPLEQIVGLSEAKETLNRDLTLRSVQDLPQKIVLLEGSPGTCKSTLIISMIKKFDLAYPNRFVFKELRTNDITAQVNTTAEKVQMFWMKMRKLNQPILLFVDEADDVFASRKNAGHIKTERTANIIQELNKEIPNLYIIAATNRPLLIDSAIRDRCNKRINCPFPTDIEMKSIIGIHLPFLDEHLQMTLYHSIILGDYKWNGRDLRHLHDELLEIQKFERLTNPEYNITSEELLKQFSYINNSKMHLKEDYLDEDISRVQK